MVFVPVDSLVGGAILATQTVLLPPNVAASLVVVPVQGATVDVYQRGTTTHVDCFADQHGAGGPVAQPLATDADGRITDSLGRIVYTAQPAELDVLVSGPALVSPRTIPVGSAPGPSAVGSVNGVAPDAGGAVTLTAASVGADAAGAAAAEAVRAVAAEGLLAPKNSPAFTGTPTAPTPPSTDNGPTLATTAFIKTLVATPSSLGLVQIAPAPNIAGAPAALGLNATPESLAQNGPFPVSPSSSPASDAVMVNEVLPGGLAAAGVIQGSPRDCSSADFLYRYEAIFVGTAGATLVVQSSPDTVTWTQEASVAAVQQGASGVWVAESSLLADQAYYRAILTNGAAAQASARLVDGVHKMAVA